MNIAIGIGYCSGLIIKLVLVLGIVKTSLKILGIGIGVKKSCIAQFWIPAYQKVRQVSNIAV